MEEEQWALQLLPFFLGPEQQEVVRVDVSVAAQCLHVETGNNDSGARHKLINIIINFGINY